MRTDASLPQCPFLDSTDRENEDARFEAPDKLLIPSFKKRSARSSVSSPPPAVQDRGSSSRARASDSWLASATCSWGLRTQPVAYTASGCSGSSSTGSRSCPDTTQRCRHWDPTLYAGAFRTSDPTGG